MALSPDSYRDWLEQQTPPIIIGAVGGIGDINKNGVLLYSF